MQDAQNSLASFVKLMQLAHIHETNCMSVGTTKRQPHKPPVLHIDPARQEISRFYSKLKSRVLFALGAIVREKYCHFH
jgi:hypothetical protein